MAALQSRKDDDGGGGSSSQRGRNGTKQWTAGFRVKRNKNCTACEEVLAAARSRDWTRKGAARGQRRERRHLNDGQYENSRRGDGENVKGLFNWNW